MAVIASALATLLHEGVGHGVIAWLSRGHSDGLSDEDLEGLEIEAFEDDDLDDLAENDFAEDFAEGDFDALREDIGH